MANLRVLPMLLLTGLTTAAIAAPAAVCAGDGNVSRGGWTIEQGTAEPSFALAGVTRSNLNVETVVLACEAGDNRRLLQLLLEVTEEGVLRPTYPHTAGMKDDPKAVVAIDGREFPVDLLFADNHVVLADAQDGRWPMLSPALADALQAGKTMTVRVDLLAKPAGTPAALAMDGEMVVDLRAPGGREAIAAVRRCAESASPNVAEARDRR